MNIVNKAKELLAKALEKVVVKTTFIIIMLVIEPQLVSLFEHIMAI